MDWFWNNFGGVITTVLAIYGAFLSSLNFWYMWKRDRKKVCVKTEFSSGDNTEYGSMDIIVVNESLRPIAINKIGFKYAYSVTSKSLKYKNFETGSFKHPRKLATAEQFSYCLYFKHVAEPPEDANSNRMLKAVPYAIDNEGKRYKGKPFEHPANFYLDPIR